MKYLILILSFSVIVPLAAAPGKSKPPIEPETAIWLEPALPGIVFFNQDRPVSGSLMLAGRLLALAGAVHFHNRYADYASAEKAARIADLYYGPGLQYKDPYSSGYKTTTEFRKEADRNLNLSGYSVAIHLILLGVGIYNGILFAKENKLEQAPVYDLSDVTPADTLIAEKEVTGIRKSWSTTHTRDLSSAGAPLPPPFHSPIFELSIPLDF
jgi:hypothetical protein